jgi:two-component sensor histidine kinase
VKEEKTIYYCIADNGIGINLDKKNAGIGLRLLDIFSRQIEGEYELKNNQGTSYIFKIPFTKNE